MLPSGSYDSKVITIGSLYAEKISKTVLLPVLQTAFTASLLQLSANFQVEEACLGSRYTFKTIICLLVYT